MDENIIDFPSNIFRSALRRALLMLFFSNDAPDTDLASYQAKPANVKLSPVSAESATEDAPEYYLRQLQKSLGYSAGSLHRELSALEAMGVVKSRSAANLRLYSVNQDYYYHTELLSIIRRSRMIPSMRSNMPILPLEEIERFCEKWKIVEFSIFGSVLRDDFGPDSDVDVMVTFSEAAKTSLFDLDSVESELAQILKRKVDLVDKRSIEASDNYIRRNHILSSSRVLYVA